MPGATVTAYEAVTGVAVASTVTDPHGAYELYILPARTISSRARRVTRRASANRWPSAPLNEPEPT